VDTAAFHLVWEREGCRAHLRGHVDELRLNALLRLLPADEPLCLDLREAHLSPEALRALRRLGAVRPGLRVEPAGLADGGARSTAGSPDMDLMAMLAHELRSPLALTHTRLQALARTLATAGRQAEAEACRRSVRDLATTTRLFDFYLTAAQPWRFEPVSLTDVVARCVQAIEDAGDAGDTAGVAFQVVSDGPAWVRGHPRALEQLVHNLVLNAAQACAPHGEVLLRLRRVAGGAELRVSDDGPGYPEAVLEHPFVPYRTDRRGGTGLGLVICKWIVDRHGGRLTLANRTRGAVARVFLPAGSEAPASHAAR
jgi:signal transduction histidine kinase